MNEDIVYFDSITIGTDEIIKGTKLKIRGNQGEFAFQRYAVNERLDVEWIDVIDIMSQHVRSFYITDVAKVVKPRKRRVKKT